MRILAVTHAYPRWAGDPAGAFLERLYQALAERGHEVAVLAPADEGRSGTATRNGVVTTWVRYAAPARETLAYRGTMVRAVRSPAGLRVFLGLLRALEAAILERQTAADVVHANWWVPAGLAARRAHRRGAPAYVVTLHGTDAALFRRSRIARWTGRPVLRDAAAVTVVSSYVASLAGRAGLNRAPAVIPMPADRPAGAHVSAGGAGIAAVGRLSRQKRVHLLLDAVAELHCRGQRVPVTIVGDGPERPALEARARHLRIAQAVRFVGMVPPEGVPDAIGDADVFVFPARGEGFGLAAAEALMLGVPVVACGDGGGVLDIVRPEAGAGLIVPPDPAKLAEATLTLLRDPGARARAAAAGAVWRDRLRPAAAAAAFEKTLRGVVAK
ncbi:MAG: glycosyltransferase [Gemmatimonadota bacterium]|nr:glycosyltransferase [Gemmatimonadota bacterium]